MKRLAFFVAALAMTSHCIAADTANIGYVDMQQVLQESKLGKQAQDKLKEKFGPKSEEFAKEEKAIAQQKQALDRDKPLMSKEQIKKKEDELQKKIESFQKNAGGIQQDLQKEQQKLAQAIVGPAQEVIQALSKEKKMGMVFERGQAGILYTDDSLNLTKEVIKRLDEKAK
jgi:outer membrane protein